MTWRRGRAACCVQVSQFKCIQNLNFGRLKKKKKKSLNLVCVSNNVPNNWPKACFSGFQVFRPLCRCAPVHSYTPLLSLVIKPLTLFLLLFPQPVSLHMFCLLINLKYRLTLTHTLVVSCLQGFACQ